MHIHAYILFNHKVNISSLSNLDLVYNEERIHGNYQPVKNKNNIITSIKKEGNFITNIESKKDFENS